MMALDSYMDIIAFALALPFSSNRPETLGCPILHALAKGGMYKLHPPPLLLPLPVLSSLLITRY